MIFWLALLAYGIAGPPVFRGGSVAQHLITHVRLPLDQTTEAQGQSPRGRKAQEVIEWRLCWICGLVVAFPATFINGDPLGVIALILLSAVIGNAIARILTDGFDYVGHGAEIIVAEQEGREGYRAAEAKRMLWSRPNASITDVEAGLRRWNWLAQFGLKYLIWRL